MKRGKYSGNPPQKDHYLPKLRWTSSLSGFKCMLTAQRSWLGYHLKFILLSISSYRSSPRAFCSVMQLNTQLSNCVGSHYQRVWRQARPRDRACPRETSLRQQFPNVQRMFVQVLSLENTSSKRNKEVRQQGRVKRTCRWHSLHQLPRD